MARAFQKVVPFIARDFKRVESVNAIVLVGKEFVKKSRRDGSCMETDQLEKRHDKKAGSILYRTR